MSGTVVAPYYVANYPTLQKVQLAAVKEGLYHPRLPTFRRMDMDTAGHKLPDQHCRTTTTSGPQDFQSATLTYFRPALQHYAGANVTDTGRSLRETYRDDLSNMKIDWAKAKESTDLPKAETKGELRFTGYAVRYLKPSVSGSWRYTFKQEPMLDQYGQRPLPANIYSRYRDTFPQYSRNIALEAWR
ncbi:sperm microtubule inner protein 8-like [Amphiura filiformis]|uniref:sperm microtubule inner protein 8-like n=1 Tax=Amphiura filiformis TaxID=82378 RepID=UPI003B20DB5B